jgi:uncharacterized protein with HEPN domain
MKRDISLYLNDIYNSATDIITFIMEMSYDDFQQDKKTILAVTKSFEIIGEAVKHIPQGFKKKYPTIEWKNMAGLRNLLVHEYFGIDLPVIWNVIESKLPALIIDFKRIIDEYKLENPELFSNI